MRTVVKWYWLNFKEHLIRSFSMSSHSTVFEEGQAFGFLGAEPERIISCLKNLKISSSGILLSIEPEALLAPKIAHPMSFERLRLSVQSLEVLRVFLESLERWEYDPIILLAMHLSQIPCDDKSNHEARYGEVINMLKRLSLKNKIVVIIKDERELLSKKNSALFERLFST